MWQLYAETLLIFAACLLIQVVLWRLLKRPDDVVPCQIVILFLLFWLIPMVYSFAFPSWDRMALSLALGACYIMSFPAASAKSPTVMIFYILHRSGGLTPAELETRLAAELDLKGDRLKDLKADGLYTGGGKPSLAGRILGYTFWAYRWILGIPLGEG